MEVFPKFIIETITEHGDCLIIGKCTYHKQLVFDKQNVKGGGWWALDKEANTFTLFGDSSDFGKAKLEDIANCINSNNVYDSRRLRRNLSATFNFDYKNEYGEIIDLKTN